MLSLAIGGLSLASVVLAFLWHRDSQRLNRQVNQLRLQAEAAAAERAAEQQSHSAEMEQVQTAHQQAISAKENECTINQERVEAQRIAAENVAQNLMDQNKSLMSQLALEQDEKVLALERARQYEERANEMRDKENLGVVNTGASRFLAHSGRKAKSVRLPTSMLIEASVSPEATGLGGMTTSPGASSCYTPETPDGDHYVGAGVGWTP